LIDNQVVGTFIRATLS